MSETLVGEGEVADHLVVKLFGAGAVQADVVGGPAAPELLAAGGKFPDFYAGWPKAMTASTVAKQVFSA